MATLPVAPSSSSAGLGDWAQRLRRWQPDGGQPRERLRTEKATVRSTWTCGTQSSVASVAAALDPVDHVVTTASMNYGAATDAMDVDRVRDAVAAKVIGPLLLAQHLQIGRSMTIFSGQVA